MSLYKYVQPDRADVVETCRIRFSPADELNDPFECLADTVHVQDPRWKTHMEDKLAEDAWVSEVIRATYEERPVGRSLPEAKSHFRGRIPDRPVELKRIAVESQRLARCHHRILCLSGTTPDEADGFLLWAHYTNSHKGMALEFDETHEWIAGHKPSPGIVQDSGPVNYASARPSLQLSENGEMFVPLEVFLTKSKPWAYEREFRLLKIANPNDLDPTPFDLLAEFPPAALRSVTFGVNSDDKLKGRVRTACQQPKLAHVRLKQASIHPDQFRLQLNLLN